MRLELELYLLKIKRFVRGLRDFSMSLSVFAFCERALLIMAMFMFSALLSSASLHAEDRGSGLLGASNDEKELKLSLSLSIPPWVMRDEDSGLKLEVLRKALEVVGYKIRPVYVSNARAYKLFEHRQLDAVLSPSRPVIHSGYLSQSIVSFQNVAISLKKKGFPEHIPISFLNNKSVVAFQKAQQFLGAEFGDMAKNNESYEEISQQSLQLNLLFLREVDFIVMDRSVFGYFWKDAVENVYPGDPRFLQDIQVHELFEPTVYHYLFLERSVRDEFDLGLKKIKGDGIYDKLVKDYEQAFKEYKPQMSSSSQ